MPTVTTPIDVAKRASITDVTSNERYSLHNVSMNHLLIRHTDTSHTHIQHTILTVFVAIAGWVTSPKTEHMPGIIRADFCSCQVPSASNQQRWSTGRNSKRRLKPTTDDWLASHFIHPASDTRGTRCPALHNASPTAVHDTQDSTKTSTRLGLVPQTRISGTNGTGCFTSIKTPYL